MTASTRTPKKMRPTTTVTAKPTNQLAAKPVRALLAKDAWVSAAIDVLGEAGAGGLAIEPLAARLGVTKGSFYWHFKNREDLLRAVIETWERVATDGVIEALEQVADPAQRLRQLFSLSLENIAQLRAEAALRAGALAGDAEMAASVQRVMSRRLAYMQSLYAALGETPSEAKRMSVVAFGAYLGAVELASHGLLLNEDGHMPRAQIATYQRLLMPAQRDSSPSIGAPSGKRRKPG